MSWYLNGNWDNIYPHHLINISAQIFAVVNQRYISMRNEPLVFKTNSGDSTEISSALLNGLSPNGPEMKYNCNLVKESLESLINDATANTYDNHKFWFCKVNDTSNLNSVTNFTPYADFDEVLEHCDITDYSSPYCSTYIQFMIDTKEICDKLILQKAYIGMDSWVTQLYYDVSNIGSPFFIEYWDDSGTNSEAATEVMNLYDTVYIDSSNHSGLLWAGAGAFNVSQDHGFNCLNAHNKIRWTYEFSNLKGTLLSYYHTNLAYFSFDYTGNAPSNIYYLDSLNNPGTYYEWLSLPIYTGTSYKYDCYNLDLTSNPGQGTGIAKINNLNYITAQSNDESGNLPYNVIDLELVGGSYSPNPPGTSQGFNTRFLPAFWNNPTLEGETTLTDDASSGRFIHCTMFRNMKSYYTDQIPD